MAREPLVCVPEGEWTVVQAQPAALPLRITLLSMGAGAALAMITALITADGSFTVWLFAWPIWGLAVTWVMVRYHDRRRRVQRRPFAVKAGAIRLPNGRVVTGDHMVTLARRNAQSGQSIVVGGSSVALGLGSMAVGVLNRLTTVSYTVDLDHDGKRTTLAGGLTEPQANAVAMEVSRRTGCFANH